VYVPLARTGFAVWIWLQDVGGAQSVPLQLPLAQSVPEEHVFPARHRLHVVAPPQSTSLSKPFFEPSLQFPHVTPVTSQPLPGDPSQLRVPAPQATQAPLVHVCVSAVQAEAVPHWPLALQVWTALPEHCVVPGVHTPVHAPLTQAEEVHADAAPHWPLALQVCTPLPLHVVPPGVHTPVQAPFTHAWFVQAAAVPHWPLALQVCTPPFRH
jgi:hypothetical protein